jgi:hypothetical protein
VTEASLTGSNLSSKQEAELLYYYDEDPDLWLYLLIEYFRSGKEQSERLKGGLLANTPEWQGLLALSKERGLGDLRETAITKQLQWTLKLQQLLMDEGHINLLSFYLRSLINLKNKKVAAIGNRGKTAHQINSIISYLANSMYAFLDRYREAQTRLNSGKSPGGADLSQAAKAYYETSRGENLREITGLLGLLVIFKGAKSTEDVENVKKYLQANLVKPLEIRLKTAGTTEEKIEIQGKITNFNKLLQLMDIQF